MLCKGKMMMPRAISKANGSNALRYLNIIRTVQQCKKVPNHLNTYVRYNNNHNNNNKHNFTFHTFSKHNYSTINNDSHRLFRESITQQKQVSHRLQQVRTFGSVLKKRKKKMNKHKLRKLRKKIKRKNNK